MLGFSKLKPGSRTPFPKKHYWISSPLRVGVGFCLSKKILLVKLRDLHIKVHTDRVSGPAFVRTYKLEFRPFILEEAILAELQGKEITLEMDITKVFHVYILKVPYWRNFRGYKRGRYTDESSSPVSRESPYCVESSQSFLKEEKLTEFRNLQSGEAKRRSFRTWN